MIANSTRTAATEEFPRSGFDTPLYGKYPYHPLTADEERQLAVRSKAGDKAARHTLVESNLALAAFIAKRYWSDGATTEDLMQEGVRGLIRAARTFDPETHRTRFSSYAVFWVRNAIGRAIMSNASLVSLPHYIFRLRTHFNMAMAHLDGPPGAGGPPRKLTDKQYRRLLHAMIKQCPYQVVGAGGGVTSLEEMVTDQRRNDSEIEHDECIDQVRKAIGILSPSEAWIIRRRFGILDPTEGEPPRLGRRAIKEKPRERLTPHSYRKLARLGRMAPDRARRIERIALRKLRDYLQPRLASDDDLG